MWGVLPMITHALTSPQPMHKSSAHTCHDFCHMCTTPFAHIPAYFFSHTPPPVLYPHMHTHFIAYTPSLRHTHTHNIRTHICTHPPNRLGGPQVQIQHHLNQYHLLQMRCQKLLINPPSPLSLQALLAPSWTSMLQGAGQGQEVSITCTTYTAPLTSCHRVYGHHSVLKDWRRTKKTVCSFLGLAWETTPCMCGITRCFCKWLPFTFNGDEMMASHSLHLQVR